ncbi:hypothetical protein DMUE_1231 [Dictyocoela muelleri]|nr:hypothetical protein DMUE_1231 [Dictyocoela muelleri]
MFENLEKYKKLQTNKKSLELANGEKTTAVTPIELEFSVYEECSLKIKDWFFICRSVYDIFLGMEFILKNGVVLDMKNETIKIDGSEYEIDHDENRKNENDETLLEKTKIYHISDDEKNEATNR